MNGRFDLTDKVAIVTGGTRGIGLALAQGLKEFGAKIVLTDIVTIELRKQKSFISLNVIIGNRTILLKWCRKLQINLRELTF